MPIQEHSWRTLSPARSAYITSTASESDQNAQSAVYSIINEANEMAGKIQSTQCTCLHHAYMHVHTHAHTHTCIHISLYVPNWIVYSKYFSVVLSSIMYSQLALAKSITHVEFYLCLYKAVTIYTSIYSYKVHMNLQFQHTL